MASTLYSPNPKVAARTFSNSTLDYSVYIPMPKATIDAWAGQNWEVQHRLLFWSKDAKTGDAPIWDTKTSPVAFLWDGKVPAQMAATVTAEAAAQATGLAVTAAAAIAISAMISMF